MSDLSHEQTRCLLHAGRGHLRPNEIAALDAHLAACAECRTHGEQLKSVQANLSRVLHLRWDSARPAEGLEHKVQARLQRQDAPRQILGFAVGIAGLVALAVMLGALFTTQTTVDAPNLPLQAPQVSSTAALETATFAPTPTATSLLTPTPTPTQVPALVVTKMTFSPDPAVTLDRKQGFTFGAEISVTSPDAFVMHIVAFAIYPAESLSTCEEQIVPTDRPFWANQKDYPAGQHSFASSFPYSDLRGTDRLLMRVSILEPGDIAKVLYCTQQVYRLSSGEPEPTPTPSSVSTLPPSTRPAPSSTPTPLPRPDSPTPPPLPTSTPTPPLATWTPFPTFTPTPTSTPVGPTVAATYTPVPPDTPGSTPAPSPTPIITYTPTP